MQRTTLFLLLVHLAFASVSASGRVGVNYGRIADNLPTPTEVVQLLKSHSITNIKLYDTDSTVLSALSSSNITVIVALPNEQLSSAANSQSFTDQWIQSNILPYHPNTLIEAIAVGNEVFVDSKNTPYLVPAMKNMYNSLTKFNLSDIKISSPVALSCLANSYPPSSGSFQSDLIEPVIKPMLSLLKQSDSYLMVNAYPFFAYISDTKTISLDYSLSQPNATGNPDPNTGLVYKTLFDAQIDAVFSAMKAIGFDDMKLIISETGWPSKGDENEFGAGPENAAAYNGNLVRRVLSGSGTPLRPNDSLTVYLFALFNENQKPGATSERNYGLFYPNQQKVYDIPLTIGGLSNRTQTNGTAESKIVGQTWCVASEKAGEEKLKAAMEYACGEGGADCRPIQPGGTCHDLESVVDQASYAFNSYYQKNSRKSGTCYFGGASYVVSQSPSKCLFLRF